MSIDTKCPGCSNHCEASNVQCGKGEAYFRGEDISSSHHGEKKGHPHGGKGEGHHGANFPAGSLADMVAKCAHQLFHGGNEAMFSVLSDDEQKYLKNLLSKILNA